MNISINQYKNTLKLIKQKAKEIKENLPYISYFSDCGTNHLALEIIELANKGLINSIGHSKDLKEATKQAILGTKKTNLSNNYILLPDYKYHTSKLPKFLIINKRLYKRLK
jgi:hypothetical protein